MVDLLWKEERMIVFPKQILLLFAQRKFAEEGERTSVRTFNTKGKFSYRHLSSTIDRQRWKSLLDVSNKAFILSFSSIF